MTLALAAAAAASAADVAPTSCTLCHSNADLFDAEVGGDGRRLRAGRARLGRALLPRLPRRQPRPGAGRGPRRRDERGLRPRIPYRGEWTAQDIPAACGRCHSDPEYMRRFRPDLRVDQETEYRTSHHGRSLAAGDKRVATCVSCHGVHDIKSSQRPGGAHLPDARGRDLRRLPLRRRAHGRIEDGRRPAAARRPARALAGERARQGARGRRSVGAYLQRLPRQSRRDAARRRVARLRLWPVSRPRIAALPAEPEVRRARRPQRVPGRGRTSPAAPTATMPRSRRRRSPTSIASCSAPPATRTTASCGRRSRCWRRCRRRRARSVTRDRCRSKDADRPVDAATYAARRDALLAEGEALGLRGRRPVRLAGRPRPRARHARDRGIRARRRRRGRDRSGSRPAARVRDPVPQAAHRQGPLRARLRRRPARPPGTAWSAARAATRRSRRWARRRACRSPPSISSSCAAPRSRPRAPSALVLRARRGGVPVREAQDEISRAIDAQIATQALLHSYSLEEGGELRKQFAAATEHAPAPPPWASARSASCSRGGGGSPAL